MLVTLTVRWAFLKKVSPSDLKNGIKSQSAIPEFLKKLPQIKLQLSV